MRNCFIPGCDKFCRLKGTLKRKMFVVPKDREMFNIWVSVLPKQRELKPHDKVCERHFAEQDISTTYDNIVNGQLYKMERGRAKLKPKAVPSRNLDCAEIAIRIKNSVLNMRNKIPVVKIQDVQTYPSTAHEEQQLEVDGEVQDITGICLKEEAPISEAEIPFEEPNEQKQFKKSDAEVLTLFESLYDDIYEVVLPNTLWGVHRCPEHSSIFFSFVDPSMLRTTKMISISCQGEVKVLLGNRLMSEQNLMPEMTSIESLSTMITDIDDLLLCSRMFDNEFCDVSLTNADSDMCEACAQVEKPPQ